MLAGLFNTCGTVKSDAALTLEHTDDAGLNSVASSSYTFPSVNLGAPSGDRLVIVGVGLRDAAAGTPQTSSLTIGGVSATLIDLFTGTARSYTMWYAVVPSGTTADIVANLNGVSCDQAGCVVWTLKNYNSATPVGYGSEDSGGTLATEEGGVAVAFMGVNRNTTMTFTNITEVADFVVGGECTMGGGSHHNTPATSLTISITSASSFPRGVYASWS